jgi:hypothetical protein
LFEDIQATAREIQSYLEPSKYPNEIDEQFADKENALSTIKTLHDNLLKEVMASEESVESVKSSNPEAEHSTTG